MNAELKKALYLQTNKIIFATDCCQPKHGTWITRSDINVKNYNTELLLSI